MRSLVVVVASMVLVGCGDSSGGDDSGQMDMETIGLQALGEAYRTISAVDKRPPKNFQELNQAAAASPGGLGNLNDKNVVVIYGAQLPDLSEEPGLVASDKILAYETKVPEQGGYVLMLDRTIKEMTPEEFKAAPKAAGTTGVPKKG